MRDHRIVGTARHGYAPAVRSTPGVVLHIAGQVHAGATVDEQVAGALASVAEICEQAGGSIADLTELHWFTTESVRATWDATEQTRARWFGSNPPAVTVVQVAGLAAPDYQVEISGTAVLDSE